MAPIEEQLIQVNMKASEDNLRYPNRLNEQYDTFIATSTRMMWLRPWRSRRYTPTCIDAWSSSFEKWKSLANTELPALNARMQEAGVPRLALGEGD